MSIPKKHWSFSSNTQRTRNTFIVLFSQIQRKYRVVRKYREKGRGGDLGLG
jgi:hypothetical protein